MDNTISINLGDDNTMESLDFHWTAGFKDGTDLMQFNEDKTENKYQLVKNRMNELTIFYLYNKDLSKIFIVDLIKGLVGCGWTKNVELKEEKQNIRLIFFRRHNKEITENCIEKSHIITYYLGFQYNDKNGNNRQVVLIIDSKGNWTLGE
jgi:hypothetical protein